MFMTNTAYAGGATSKSVQVRAFVASTGLPKTDLVYNTSGLTASFQRGSVGSFTSITLATLANAQAAYSSGGFVHIGGGLYRLDVPDAALAAGVDYVNVVLSGVSDCVITSARVEILGADPRSATGDANVTHFNGTAISDAELTGVPAANASLDKKIRWLFLLARNKITQTATTQTVLADDGTTTVATATVSDNGTTATRNEFA